MKQLLFKLFFVPFIAFFTMMITVALMGQNMITKMPWLFPDKNAWIVYVIWVFVLFVLTIIHHFTRKTVADK